MIHLSRREAWIIVIILAVFVAGQFIYRCRQPRQEYIPGRIESGVKLLEGPPAE